MCHGHIDPRFALREVEDRLRAAAPSPASQPASDGRLPPELMGLFPGLWARLTLPLARKKPAQVPFAAE